ncbi:MAG TPA: hypothetical protein VHY59_13665 [Chthoniobacterales bacterium]|nr:hypothetical protein [Chthoniobacterales bacterium]
MKGLTIGVGVWGSHPHGKLTHRSSEPYRSKVPSGIAVTEHLLLFTFHLSLFTSPIAPFLPKTYL